MTDEPSHIARNALITTIVAIVASPLSLVVGYFSLVVGYFLNHQLARPALTVEYVAQTTRNEDHTLDSGVVAATRLEGDVSERLRDAVMQLTVADGVPPCVEWLDDDTAWQDRCSRYVTEASIRVATMLRTALAAPPLPPLPTLSKGDAQRKLHVLDRVAGEMRKVDVEPEMPRTGWVSFTAGIINHGDSDGFVRSDAKLKFAGKELWLYSDEYVVVKAHSFEKIEFKLGPSEQDTVTESQLRDAVIKHQKDPYTLVLDTGTGDVQKTDNLIP